MSARENAPNIRYYASLVGVEASIENIPFILESLAEKELYDHVLNLLSILASGGQVPPITFFPVPREYISIDDITVFGMGDLLKVKEFQGRHGFTSTLVVITIRMYDGSPDTYAYLVSVNREGGIMIEPASYMLVDKLMKQVEEGDREDEI